MSVQLDNTLFDKLNTRQFTGNRAAPIYGDGGLEEGEIVEIERKLGFKMPDDFRFLLKNLKDPGQVFFPWKKFEITDYHEKLEWIISGIEFDIEHNDFWLSRWGEKPTSLEDAKAIMRNDFKVWPKLLPVSGHRFLAAEPCETGNPVFSIWQTDIICYGASLGEYLLNEFVGQSQSEMDWVPRREIPVWHDF